MRRALAAAILLPAAMIALPVPPAAAEVSVAVTRLQIPAAVQWTNLDGFNDRGEVAGGYFDGDDRQHHGVWRSGEFGPIETGPTLGTRVVAGIGGNGRVAYTRTTFPEWVVYDPDGRSSAHAWLAGATGGLQPFGATESAAGAISPDGAKIALSVTYTGLVTNRLAVWNNGSINAAPTSVDGVTRWDVRAINNGGQVLFERRTRGSGGWFFDGRRVREIAGFGDAEHLTVRGLNAAGQVIGNTSGPTMDDRRAFLWRDGAFTDLGTLGGQMSAAPIGPQGVNDAGHTVGSSTTATGAEHAFVWRDGRMTDLGTLPGHVTSEAVAINARGQVFGYSAGADRIRRPVLWQDGAVHDLSPDEAGYEIVRVNDRGQVLVSSGSRRAEVWTVG